MKKLIALSLVVVFAISCGENSSYTKKGEENKAISTTPPADKVGDNAQAGANPSYDPKRGEGKFTKVELSLTLDAAKADGGKKVYEVKCSGSLFLGRWLTL